MKLPSKVGALRDWALHSEGSTRPIGLLRIAFAILVWTRFGAELTLAAEPLWAWPLLALGFHASTALVLLGMHSRLAMPALALILHVMVYGLAVELVRPQWDQHIARLMCSISLLLALSPTGRSYSVDRLRAQRRHAVPPGERGNLWTLRLIALQVSAVYIFSAYDKLTPAFLSGDRLLQLAMSAALGSESLEGQLGVQLAFRAGALLTVSIELFLGFALFIRRLRPVALLIGIGFHAALALCLPVGIFSAMQVCLYLAFLEPDTVHRWLDEFHAETPAS